jgi:hypothetical protein
VTIFAPAAGFENEEPSSRKRLGSRSNSKSPSRPGPRSRIGSPRSRSLTNSIYSRTGSEGSGISRPVRVRGSSIPGLTMLGSLAPPTGHTRCEGQRQR